jgi:hypothetical protein
MLKYYVNRVLTHPLHTIRGSFTFVMQCAVDTEQSHRLFGIILASLRNEWRSWVGGGGSATAPDGKMQGGSKTNILNDKKFDFPRSTDFQFLRQTQEHSVRHCVCISF